MNKLIELLKIESKQIDTAFQKTSLEGKGTSQEVADRREQVFVKGFLEKYFPFPYRIVKGNVVDRYGRESNSIDCVVLAPSHPYTIDVTHGAASVILADGVDMVVEVKPDISSFGELIRGLKQVQSIKKLRRQRTSHLKGFGKSYTDEQLAVFKQIPCFIFSVKGPVDIKVFIEKIYKYYMEESIPISEQFDYIVINNDYLIVNSNENLCGYLGNTNGICFIKSNENTLAYFLYYLNTVPRSEIQLSKNILNYYIKQEELNEGFKTYNDLNAIYR